MPSTRQTYERALGRYNVGGSVWPENVPALSTAEALRAARRLYRWARGRPFTGMAIATSGNRYSYHHSGALYVNPEKGWRELVHNLAHDFWHAENPGEKPHSKHEARFEIRMAKEVVRRGWLEGKLKDKPKKPKKEPTKEEVKESKMNSIKTRIAKWETKAKRAENALRKLRRSLAFHQRVITQKVMNSA